MRIVAGVDWSDEAFAAVEQIGLLYQPDDVVLVHGVAQTANLQGTVEFRQALLDAGRQIVERYRALLPAETPSIRALCESQDPASFILDSVATVKPDLIAMGMRDLSRVMKVFIGSVSHRVLLHATVPTLIVKGKARPIARVLMAVQGQEDATRLQTWLTAHPFKNPVTITILSVLAPLHNISDQLMVGQEGWSAQSKRDAEQVVKDTAQALASPRFTVSTDVRPGDPATTVCEVGQSHDLIVVSSHGAEGAQSVHAGQRVGRDRASGQLLRAPHPVTTHIRGCLKTFGWLKNFWRSANSTLIRSSPCPQVKAVGSWARDFARNRLRRDPVPERLYEIDPLINRMIVKTWRRNENYLEYGMSSLEVQMALAVGKNSSQE